MHQENTLTPPTRCTECNNPMETPVACSTCGALSQRPADTFDCFELFGLPRSFDVDLGALHRKYLSLTRVIHPDIAGSGQGAQRHQSLSLSAELNRAYETLRDPVSRAEYLLATAGGPDPSQDKTVPPDLLGEVMMIREEIEEAAEADDHDAIKALTQQLTQRREATLVEVGDLVRKVDEEGAAVHAPLREKLNTIKYWNNLLMQMPRSDRHR